MAKKQSVKPAVGDAIRKTRLRSGGPSMEAPGAGDIRQATLPKHGERSAAHYADALTEFGAGQVSPPIAGRSRGG